MHEHKEHFPVEDPQFDSVHNFLILALEARYDSEFSYFHNSLALIIANAFYSSVKIVRVDNFVGLILVTVGHSIYQPVECPSA